MVGRPKAVGLSFESDCMSAETFWAHFAANVYERHPTVFDLDELGGNPFCEEQAARVLRLAFGRSTAKSIVRQERRFHVDFKPIFEPFIEDEDLPRSDEPLSQFLRRIYDRVGGKDLTLVAHNCHIFAPDLYEGVRSFFSPLFRQVGVPAFSLGTDLFAGMYRTGPNNIHKDMGGVFTFLVTGREKSMICWPFEYFEKIAPGTKFRNFVLKDVRPEDHLKAAHIVTAKPGQAIYFPAHWWHAAYSDNLDPVATLNATFYLSADVKDLLLPPISKALDEASRSEDRVDHLIPPLNGHKVTDLQDLPVPPQAERALKNAWRLARLHMLSRASATGFMTSVEASHGFSIEEGKLWVGKPEYPVCAVRDADCGFLLANGRVIECSLTQDVLDTLEIVNSGKPFDALQVPARTLVESLIGFGAIVPSDHIGF